MVQMQFGVDNHSQIFHAVCVYSRGLTQLYSKSSRLVFLEKEITVVLVTLSFLKLYTCHPRTQFII